MTPLASAAPLVLIVEDEPSIARLLAEVLREDLGVVTQVAHTGAAALAQLATVPPALVLLDLVLPDLQGAALVHSLRPALPPDTRLIICSVLAVTQADLPQGLSVDASLSKPFELDRLTATVQRYLPVAGAAARRTVPVALA